MPKNDGLKRVDDAPVRYIRPASPEGGASIGGTGNADTLDGFHATRVPVPNAIPVTDGSGYLSPFVDPNNAINGAQATAWTGMRYIAPTARLMAALSASDTTIVTSAPLFNGDNEKAILSHYSLPNEAIWIMGTAEADGKYWRYPVQRGKAIRGVATLPQAFPLGTEVISLGGDSSGGYIYASSAYDGNSPYLAMYQNNGDKNRSASWKAQYGRLSDVPSSFKALFPQQDNWDRFGVAAQDAYFDGGIFARYGQISGSLSVTGQFYVNDTLSNARMEVGFTPSGWGQVFRDTFGQPVWQVVMPWPDKDGNRPSDIVWTVNSFGERAIYFRREGDEWVLSQGGFDIRENSMTSGNFGIYPADKKLQFEDDNYIGWSGSSGFVENNSVWVWADTINLGKTYPNSDVEHTPGEGYSTVKVWDTLVVGSTAYDGPTVYKSGSLSVNGSTATDTLSVSGTDDGSFAVLAPPSFQYTSGTSTANPATDAPTEWLKVIKNGLVRYIPLYA